MSRDLQNTRLTRWGMLALVFAMVAAFSLIGIGGCSNNGIKSAVTEFDAESGEDNLILTDSILDEVFLPDEETFAKSVGGSRTLVVDVLPVNPTTIVTYTATAHYSPDGFVMIVDFDGEEVVFRFPENAVSAATAGYLGTDSTITIAGVKTSTVGEDDTYEYTCSPHGLVFTYAVQVTQPYAAPEGTLLGLYYYDTSARSAEWEFLGSSPISGGSADFDLWHFSKYGISE